MLLKISRSKRVIARIMCQLRKSNHCVVDEDTESLRKGPKRIDLNALTVVPIGAEEASRHVGWQFAHLMLDGAHVDYVTGYHLIQYMRKVPKGEPIDFPQAWAGGVNLIFGGTRICPYDNPSLRDSYHFTIRQLENGRYGMGVYLPGRFSVVGHSVKATETVS